MQSLSCWNRAIVLRNAHDEYSQRMSACIRFCCALIRYLPCIAGQALDPGRNTHDTHSQENYKRIRAFYFAVRYIHPRMTVRRAAEPGRSSIVLLRNPVEFFLFYKNNRRVVVERHCVLLQNIVQTRCICPSNRLPQVICGEPYYNSLLPFVARGVGIQQIVTGAENERRK